MKKTIVLCSYNGEKYIKEQLESLKRQSVKPDEVLVFDDRSTDHTTEIVQQFIDENKLNNWKLIVREKNMGWKKGFIDAFKQADGDIIFPCDQDDVWDEYKIEKMSSVMEMDENVQVLVGNYRTLYEGEEYQKIDKVFSRDLSNDGTYHKINADEKGVYICRPGCVMAFRKSFFEFAMQYYFEDYPHDALLWRNAVYADGLYQLNYEVIAYRRHGGNASDVKKHTRKEKYESVCYYIQVIDQLMKMTLQKEDKEKAALLERTRKVWELRKKYYETGNIFCWLKLFLFNRKYYLTLKAVLGDLYLVMFNR